MGSIGGGSYPAFGVTRGSSSVRWGGSNNIEKLRTTPRGLLLEVDTCKVHIGLHYCRPQLVPSGGLPSYGGRRGHTSRGLGLKQGGSHGQGAIEMLLLIIYGQRIRKAVLKIIKVESEHFPSL